MGDIGENVFLEQGREERRTLRPTRRAESSAFTGERDEELEATLRTDGAGEA
jgi:hypothetical protein